MNIQIGSTPGSWGIEYADDTKQIPWQRYLDEVARAGYEWTELGTFGYLPTDSKVLSHELRSRGLKLSGAHVFLDLTEPIWSRVKAQVTEVSELLASLDARFLLPIPSRYCHARTGERLGPAVLTEGDWAQFVDMINRVAEYVLDSFGLRLAFHPHTETAVEYEDQIERLLDETDPSRVWLCLDTGHHLFRGGDPIRFLRQHHNRIPYLHLKNVDSNLMKRVNNENIHLGDAVAMGVFCEPSRGMLDFVVLRDVLAEIDYQGWGIVEQGMYPAPFDKPFVIAKRSVAYMRQIGLY